MSNTDTPPASPAPAPSARPASIGRGLIGLNVFLQVVFVLVIAFGLNWLSFRHFKRWDFSRNQKFALSSQTRNVLNHLDKPVHAIVFFPQAQALFGDVSSLLREYEYASNRKFVVEQVDPYRNLTRARELSEKYKFGSSDNIVILDCDGKSKFVNAQDMAEVDNSGAMMGQPPTIKAFKGEEAITSALMEITEARQNKLYFTTGHGEAAFQAMPSEQPGQGDEIGGFLDYMKRQNVKTAELNLNNVDEVPADASGLLIFGPKTDFTEREVQLINKFWNDRKGRLFVLLNPLGKTHRLDAWLTEQGVTPQNDRIIKTGTVMTLDPETNQPAIRTGIIPYPVVNILASGKAVTKDAAGVDSQLLGAAESLKLNQNKAMTDKIQVSPILQSDKDYWGSTTYAAGTTKQVFFDPQKDHEGPLTVGVAVEKGALEDQRVKVDTARMIVIGNAGYLTDAGLQRSEVGIDFTLNAINWMFNRETVAGIPPKAKEQVKLSLNEKQMNNLAYLVLLGIPGFVGLIGLAVWWQRRS